MGCERNLLTVTSLFCAYIGFNIGISRGKPLVLVAAVVAWLLLSFGLKLMGKADPYMNEVFRRATQYSDKPFHIQFHVPARSAVGARPRTIARKRWM
jgi:type IV secretory pathway TrbD component